MLYMSTTKILWRKCRAFRTENRLQHAFGYTFAACDRARSDCDLPAATHAISMNRSSRALSVAVLAVALLLMLEGNCGAQSTASYVFASPSLAVSLSDQDARGNLDSFEQANITAVADRIACSMTRAVRITDAVGVYDASAENSFIVQTNLGQADSEYVGSLLARYAHQKFALVFLANPAGTDRLWIVESDQPWDAVAKDARDLQVVPLTLAKGQAKTEIIVVDFGSKLAEKLKAFASTLHATPQITNGAAELLGDPDRAKAMSFFDLKLKSMEQETGRHLSRNLWTQPWHDATSRTCSLPGK